MTILNCTPVRESCAHATKETPIHHSSAGPGPQRPTSGTRRLVATVACRGLRSSCSVGVAPSQASSGSWGWTIQTVEILHGQDMLSDRLFEEMRCQIHRCEFAYIHAGTPCSTFSTARHPRLRSAEAPHGLDGLQPEHKLIVRDANELLRRTLLAFAEPPRVQPTLRQA